MLRKHHLFHITPLEHLASIISSDVLRCAQTLLNQGNLRPDWWHSAYWRRIEQTIPLARAEALARYVHFYFFKHPPQLHRSPTIPAQQWAYLITDVASLREANYTFLWTDGDPLLLALTQFYPQAHPFDPVDWSLQHHDQWRPTTEDLDLDRRRSASLLVHKRVEFRHIRGICVATPEAEQQVRQVLRQHQKGHVNVIIRPHWF